jgi:diguanylate cyclase (GGDEF)-like protein
MVQATMRRKARKAARKTPRRAARKTPGKAAARRPAKAAGAKARKASAWRPAKAVRARTREPAEAPSKEALLGKAALFAQLSPDELSTIARYSGYRSCAAGEVIFREGTHRAELFLIRRGTVVIRRGREGNGEQDIARFVDGEVFGEMDLLDTAPRTASAIAESPTTLLVFPDAREFADILSKHPAVFARILRKLLGEIARRIRAIDRLMSEKTPWIEELKRQLHRDRLTGLYNRAFLDEQLPKIVGEHARTSFLVAKPDNFKTINDTYGHEAGDRTLVLLSEVLKAHLHGGDLGVRYRGDEYCMVLPGQGVREAAAAAELLRAAIRSIDMKPVTGSESFVLTGSVGVSSHPQPATDAKALVSRAFEQMWSARNGGGDRVLVEAVPP